MKYQLLVFDWDGTLYDSLAYIVACVQAVARRVDLPVPDEATVRQMIGLSVDESLRRMFPDLSPMKIADVIKAYREYVHEAQELKPSLYMGSEDVLRELNQVGYWLSVATGKPRPGLDKDLSDLGLCDCFLATRTADESDSKPNPQMLLDIMDRLGVVPERALVIGDTEYDMLMAKNANVDALAVSYGSHDHEEMLKIDNVKGVIHDIRELPGWLCGVGKGVSSGI